MQLSSCLPSRTSRLIFTLLMAWVWSGAVHLASAENPPIADGSKNPSGLTAEQFEAAVAQFERGIRAMQDADRDGPRDNFDLPLVARQLGPDAGKLFEWVRDRTVWVPYRGSLRGEMGVLMDRMGNSLDRALLLAALLKASGHTARLAHAELTAEAARALQLRNVPKRKWPHSSS